MKGLIQNILFKSQRKRECKCKLQFMNIKFNHNTENDTTENDTKVRNKKKLRTRGNKTLF